MIVAKMGPAARDPDMESPLDGTLMILGRSPRCKGAFSQLVAALWGGSQALQ